MNPSHLEEEDIRLIHDIRSDDSEDDFMCFKKMQSMVNEEVWALSEDEVDNDFHETCTSSIDVKDS